MRTVLCVQALVCLAIGCSSPPSPQATPPEPAPTPPAPTCDVSVVETVPADGATDAYHRAPVEFHLSAPDPEARVVAGFAGTQTTRDDGRIVVFTPDAPLAPGATYEVGLEFCHGSPTISFATSDLGTELATSPDDLVGRTWVVDLANARFPAGDMVADLVASVFTDRLLVGITALDGDAIQLRIAIPLEGEPVAQDRCFRTLELPAGVFREAPYFEVSGVDVDFDAYAGEIHLADFVVSGTLSADASLVGGGTLRTTVDARDLSLALGLLDEAALCDIAAGLGAGCGPCPDGEATCVTVEADHIEAEWVEGLSLEPITAPDAAEGC